MAPVRVTHLIRSLDAGGAEITLTRMVLGATLVYPEVDHSVVVFKGAGRLESSLESAGIHVDSPRRAQSGYVRVVSATRSLARNRPDVIQAWMPHSCVVAAVIGRILRIPVIWTLRMRADRRGVSRLAWILTRLMCGPLQWMPRAIVACSDEVAASHRSLGLRRDMLVIENGIDTTFLTPAQRASARFRFHVPPGAFVIGRGARWDPAKDFSTLLDAAKLVIGAAPHVLFLLVGRGVDGQNRELTEQVTVRGLESSFILVGETQDMAEFYAACDVVCSSSSTEGFPNTILEALAAGVPVVATDVGGSSRILGDTGWLVPPGDPRALADALLDAVSTSSSDLARRAERGRARVQREFSTRRMVSDYHQLYQILVRDTPGR